MSYLHTKFPIFIPIVAPQSQWRRLSVYRTWIHKAVITKSFVKDKNREVVVPHCITEVEASTRINFVLGRVSWTLPVNHVGK